MSSFISNVCTALNVDCQQQSTQIVHKSLLWCWIKLQRIKSKPVKNPTIKLQQILLSNVLLSHYSMHTVSFQKLCGGIDWYITLVEGVCGGRPTGLCAIIPLLLLFMT